MMEPRRLLEQGATDAERALLHSARADEPPAGAARKMLIALEGMTAGSGPPSPQGSGQALGAPSAPVAAHAVKLSGLAKIGLAAVVGLGALGAGALVHRIAGQRSVMGETSVARAPVMQETPVTGASESERPMAVPTSEPSVVPTRASGTVPRRRSANATNESLSAETHILDVAHSAVDAHNPAAAQRALDSYAQRFPQGHLKPEATVLHLTVLVRQGQRAAARSLATQLLASESYKAYEYRIRSLLRETEE